MSADSSRPTTVSLTRSSPDYPPLLRQIADPPDVLWVRGRLPRRPSVAIVGSRDCSRYGRRVARRLGRDLAALGLTVVSGLARGVDAAAHRGALETGATVAVLPCGIDRVYPARHESLAARIVERGALVTENPPRTEVAPYHFPVRNARGADHDVDRVIIGPVFTTQLGRVGIVPMELARLVVTVIGPEHEGTADAAEVLVAMHGRERRVDMPATSVTVAVPRGI